MYSPLTCIDFTSAAEGDVLVAQRIYMWCDNLYYFAIACLLLCAAVSLGIAGTIKLHSCPPYVFIVFIALPINHHLAKLLFLLFRYKASVNCSDFTIIMFISNGWRYEMSFKLLQSSEQQPCIFSPRIYLNLNAVLLGPGLFDYPQTGSRAGFHSFHHV